MRKFRTDKADIGKSAASQTRKGLLYIIVFFLTWLPGSVNRLHELLFPQQQVFWMVLLHSAFTSSQGFFNACVYAQGRIYRFLSSLMKPFVLKFGSSKLILRAYYAEAGTSSCSQSSLIDDDHTPSFSLGV